VRRLRDAIAEETPSLESVVRGASKRIFLLGELTYEPVPSIDEATGD
jgi:hypothetical protein